MRRPFDAVVAGLPPNRRQAEAFLRWLDGEAARFSFRTFSATPYTRVAGDDPLEFALDGGLNDCWQDLSNLNRRGAAINVTINATNGRGRAAKDITRIRALFVDDDQPSKRRYRFRVAPDMTVRSSPGRFHHYWLVADLALADFVAAQKRLACHYHTDLKICALNQSMALPGFWRRKSALRAHLTELCARAESSAHVPSAYELLERLLASP